MTTWLWLLLAVAVCYLLKLAGLLVPERVMAQGRVRSVVALLPVALLGALIAVQTFITDGAFALDARVVGLAAAGVALLLRAPFLVVVLVAAVVTAACRALF